MIKPQGPAPRRSKGMRHTGTREQLLAAAREIVRDRGLAHATSRDITAVAGANLAAITYHFGSKDELIAEALFAELERRVLPALELLDSGPAGDETEVRASDAAAAMLAAVQALMSEFERSRAEAPLYLEALVLAVRDDAYGQRARAVIRRIRRRLGERVTELQAAGVVPRWVDPEAMAGLILAAANGLVLQVALDPGGPAPASIAAHFAGLLLAASNQATT